MHNSNLVVEEKLDKIQHMLLHVLLNQEKNDVESEKLLDAILKRTERIVKRMERLNDQQ